MELGCLAPVLRGHAVRNDLEAGELRKAVVDTSRDTVRYVGRIGILALKFFGGLSVEKTAEVLKISPQTVMRDWKMARAWLMGELAHE